MEPQLTKDQYGFLILRTNLHGTNLGYRVAEIEDKIGSGLIEELVHVAEGELKLVDIMVQAKVYVSSPMLERLQHVV